MQRVILLAKVRRHVGRREEASGQIVGPRVIRTLDATCQVTFRGLAQTRAAMPADIEQRIDRAGFVTRDDHALACDRAREVVAGVGNLISAPRANPAIT